MAIREKTIQFSVPSQLTLVPDAVVTSLSQITLHIPEANPTFTSVIVEVGFHDMITATGGTIAEHRVGLRLGATAVTNITEVDDITNTGENISGIVGPFDFTSHFNTNWTGTSMLCDIQVFFDQSSGTTLGMANVSAIIYITYTYDDLAPTQIKTVRIPIESLSGLLPTTRDNSFGNQVPVLTGASGILPEAGIVIRNYSFIIEGNTCQNNNTTTDPVLNIGLDNSSTNTFMATEAALGSDVYGRWIWNLSAIPDTTVGHLLQVWSTGIARFNHITITLVITYEFTLTGTSRVLNSIVVPIEISSPLGLNTATEASRLSRDIFINEPGTITMRQSGFRINWNSVGVSASLFFRAGSQTYRSCATTGSTVCGMFSYQQRIDSGSAVGQALVLTRGRNTFVIDGYSNNSTTEFTNLNGYIILNYESDLSVLGIGAHNHTVYKIMRQWDAANVDLVRINNYAFNIPESSYFLVSVGFNMILWQSSGANAITFDVECLSSEGRGGGYYDIYVDAYTCDAERACSSSFMQGRESFLRFPGDADSNRVNIETARDYRFYCASAVSVGITALVTYHSFTWSVAGNISGHNASLPTQLKLIRVNDDQILNETTLSAGVTSFNFTVYDNTEQYYVSAFQSNALVGRSSPGVAT